MVRFLPEGYPVSAARVPVITILACSFLYNFNGVQAVYLGKVFAVVLGELAIRRYSLSTEHNMTKRHLGRGTFVLPTCCFKRSNLSARYV